VARRVPLSAELISGLSRDERGIISAVALHEDGGSPPDVEIGHGLLDHLVGAREQRG
jgi:hypothetical protein